MVKFEVYVDVKISDGYLFIFFIVCVCLYMYFCMYVCGCLGMCICLILMLGIVFNCYFFYF